MKKMQLFYIFELNEPKKANVAAEEPKNLHVEWPPSFNFETLFKNTRRKKRAPNAFILFRIKYLESLQQVGVNWPMSKVSRMASAAWKRQPEHIKTKYESLSFAANLSWAKWNPRPNVINSGVQRNSQRLVNNSPNLYRSPAYFANLDTNNAQIFGDEMNSE
ncbi:3026_t:CDS:1 [Ambispora leptoticha]|uniref:3026_t:CDS:1 n=1 Tax=Ambispora leptoticha TaxID=144679 RepID=A0A9N9BC15_9GLOM|nr:3026_t:CDS:1 [Ambispora leptoticha]